MNNKNDLLDQNTSFTGVKHPLNIVVIVAALGYFVDIYDLILFSIVRVPSLKEIGIAEADLKSSGLFLLNMQMIGMLLGGIVWGILGDKKGRLSVLFLTILLYSLANIANGFVQTYNQYAVLRVIAGFGLAGELGVGITLVSEVMTKEHRGYGTSIVGGIGIAGAVLAYYVSEFGWREAYWAGGVLGLLLLILRIYVHESGMFDGLKQKKVRRGHFGSLFKTRQQFIKYLSCIFIGLPVWFVIGILITFSNDFAKYLGITGDIVPGRAVMFHYVGASIGSVSIGFLSQWIHSRKKALLIALISVAAFCGVYFSAFGASVNVFYLVMFLLGIAQGYWALFVTVASEQFGTNIRSTVTTTVPNFVRGATVGMLLLWNYLALDMGKGIWTSAIIVGSIVMALAFFGLYKLGETYGKELDYTE